MFEVFVCQEGPQHIDVDDSNSITHIHKSYLLTNVMIVERNQIKIQTIQSFTTNKKKNPTYSVFVFVLFKFLIDSPQVFGIKALTEHIYLETNNSNPIRQVHLFQDKCVLTRR